VPGRLAVFEPVGEAEGAVERHEVHGHVFASRLHRIVVLARAPRARDRVAGIGAGVEETERILVRDGVQEDRVLEVGHLEHADLERPIDRSEPGQIGGVAGGND
jgi:hypothetical protein